MWLKMVGICKDHQLFVKAQPSICQFVIMILQNRDGKRDIQHSRANYPNLDMRVCFIASCSCLVGWVVVLFLHAAGNLRFHSGTAPLGGLYRQVWDNCVGGHVNPSAKDLFRNPHMAHLLEAMV